MSSVPNLLEPQFSSPESISQQVDRILRSNTFHASEVLRNLLSFLAARSAQNPTEHIKVKDIATAVFGRSENFDSQGDSVVRVHMVRLRAKLAEYYVDEGGSDDLIISIPKGSYSICSQRRQSTLSPADANVESPPAVPSTEQLQQAQAPKERYLWAYGALTILLMMLAALVARWTAPAKDAQAQVTPALATFWKSFANANDTPLIVFSNLKLVGSLHDGMHVYRSGGVDRNKTGFESWTTIGEVFGVYDISNTLSLFRKSVQVKRGPLLTWDDAKDTNVIFVGGPLADTPLRDLSAFREFEFKNDAPGIPAESGAIVNVNPRQGEASLYRGPEARPFQFDYAVVSLRSGFNKSHRVLALAGITEYGTEGAPQSSSRVKTR